MLCGIVDMGSNSIRLSVYQCGDGKFTQIINKKIMAGLAGYVKKGKLTRAGIDKAAVFHFIVIENSIAALFAHTVNKE